MKKQILAGLLICLAILPCGRAVDPPHTTYLWHLHQPIYWNARRADTDRYETAWESIQQKDGGRAHPEDNLRDIFGKDDRVAAYQYRPRDAVSAISGYSEAGAQVNYTGALMENVNGLGSARQLGYSSSWKNAFIEAKGWKTSAGFSRLDIVNSGHHHPLLPLLTARTVEMEILLMQETMSKTWGTPLSKGFFPLEICFSERLIPILKKCGIEWTIVANDHISRACANFPVVYGSGGINCDPPNKADQINPSQDNWYRAQIDRGCSPCNAAPFAYIPHKAKFVNPETGAEDKITVVPADSVFGWQDGYGSVSAGNLSGVTSLNNGARPELILSAHDGDNAFGGGYSYYMECVPNFCQSAVNAGLVPTTIQQYLSKYPVPDDDVVKVEDGGWPNADSDFGSPVFLNWIYPLLSSSGQIDVENGWHEKVRDQAIFLACENRVRTAEQIAGVTPRMAKILNPDSSTHVVERAWHYYLGSLDSGNVYFGPAGDNEVKATIGCNEAVAHIDSIIGASPNDTTTPSIWNPQRQPYNPGSVNFGCQYGYKQMINNGDFYIWTFVYDVSEIEYVKLHYRTDKDGVNPLSSNQNETFAGGSEVNAWQSVGMNRRVFPKDNVYNNPTINFFVLPTYIADEYWVKVTGLRSVLIDYYVEAKDAKGNIAKSDIQHVWIGNGEGATTDRVTFNPDPPVRGMNVTITYDTAGGALAGKAAVYIHKGINNWTPVDSPDMQMTPLGGGKFTITYMVPANAMQIDFVFNDGAGTWDNNNGQDWHKATTGATTPTATPTPTGTPGPTQTPGPTHTPTPTPTPIPTPIFVMDGNKDGDVPVVAENGGGHLYAKVTGDWLYVATEPAGGERDKFIFIARTPGALGNAPWAKSGQAAAWDAFLANESSNNWTGWFNASGTVIAPDTNHRTAVGAVLEGMINMKNLFGSVPDAIYICAAPYSTADSGALFIAGQIPASQNADANIDAGEFFKLVFTLLTKGILIR